MDATNGGAYFPEKDEEETVRWGALEKMPTYDRLRTSILKSVVEGDNEEKSSRVVYEEVDVGKLDEGDREKFIRGNFKVVDDDNEKFLERLRNRFDR